MLLSEMNEMWNPTTPTMEAFDFSKAFPSAPKNRAERRAAGMRKSRGRGSRSRSKARRHPHAWTVVDGVTIVPPRKAE